jgi:signal transduction histidine kinase
MAFEPRHSTANVVSAADRLHDPGLPFGDLLARLLPVGVLIVDDDGSCRYASPLACAALGVTDGNALSMAWRRVATHPELARRTSLRAGDPPLQIVADLPGDVPRRLPLEVHRTEDMSVVLEPDVRATDATDRVLQLANEAQAHRRALSGLVHEAKGPLNNFQLTLALLNAGLTRLEESAAASDVTARWRRHFGVLQSETARLTARLGDIDALAHAADAGRLPVDIATLLRNVMHVLRHDATMSELAIDVESTGEGIIVRADSRALRLALLGLTACVFEATPPGDVVRVCVERLGDDGAHIRIHAATTRLPTELHAAMFRIGCGTDARYVAAGAGRVIIEAHGGTLAVHDDGGVFRGFDIRLPNGGFASGSTPA